MFYGTIKEIQCNSTYCGYYTNSLNKVKREFIKLFVRIVQNVLLQQVNILVK